MKDMYEALRQGEIDLARGATIRQEVDALELINDAVLVWMRFWFGVFPRAARHPAHGGPLEGWQHVGHSLARVKAKTGRSQQ